MAYSKTKKREEPAIVCFAGCDWWYHNRGLFVQQVMVRLAKERKVLFVNSLGMRIPSITADKDAIKKILRKFRSIMRFIRKDENGMYVFSPISIPFQNKIGKKINQGILELQLKFALKILRIENPVYYIGCPPAWEIVKKQSRSFLMYEKTDLFEEMSEVDKDYIVSLDSELSNISDLVLYVNKNLWQEGLKKNPNSLLLGHGVDFDLFANANKSEYIPEDIAEIPKPIIGFFGMIDDKACDHSLLEYVARKLNSMSLVLVGPISSDVSKLRAYKNVYFLGQKTYEEIPHYGKVFDVAIMPWKQNKWIEFCNPVKTKEYLALGNPIVTIYYPEIDPYEELVYVARSQEEFIAAIQRALTEKDEEKKEQRRHSVKDETWKNKVSIIEDLIEKG